MLTLLLGLSHGRQLEARTHHHRVAAAGHGMGATHPVEQQQPASNCRSKHTQPDRHHRERAGGHKRSPLRPAAHPQAAKRDLRLRLGVIGLVLRAVAMTRLSKERRRWLKRLATEKIPGHLWPIGVDARGRLRIVEPGQEPPPIQIIPEPSTDRARASSGSRLASIR